jgi:hypothetical protein
MEDDSSIAKPTVHLFQVAFYFGAACFFILSVAWFVVPMGTVFRGKEVDFRLLYVAGTAGALAALIGFGLIRAGRLQGPTASILVIPPQDEKYLGPWLQRSPDPIGDYTRLAGLVGGTGLFRKLEFSGMPLATISMTLVLCLLSLITSTVGEFVKVPDQLAMGFFDLAKLTLGAFIGSFVTKTSSREAEASRAGAVAAATGAAAASGQTTRGENYLSPTTTTVRRPSMHPGTTTTVQTPNLDTPPQTRSLDSDDV